MKFCSVLSLHYYSFNPVESCQSIYKCFVIQLMLFVIVQLKLFVMVQLTLFFMVQLKLFVMVMAKLMHGSPKKLSFE